MATTEAKGKGKGTDEKVGPKQKRCVDCGQVKHRFKSFKPRWGRCDKHREQGKPFQEKCKGCQEMRQSNIRQPRCIECDAIRKVATTKVTAKSGKKGKKGKKGTKVQVPAPAPTPATATTAAAPEPEPTPAVADALAVVSNLLAEEPAQEVPDSTPF